MLTKECVPGSGPRGKHSKEWENLSLHDFNCLLLEEVTRLHDEEKAKNLDATELSGLIETLGQSLLDQKESCSGWYDDSSCISVSSGICVSSGISVSRGISVSESASSDDTNPSSDGVPALVGRYDCISVDSVDETEDDDENDDKPTSVPKYVAFVVEY